MRATIEQQKERELSKLRKFIRLQGKAISTERQYCGYVARFIDFLMSDECPKSSVSEKKLEAFLTLMAEDDCAESTQNTAFHAVCYYYRHVREVPLVGVDAMRSKTGQRVRQAPGREDTRKVLMAVKDSGGYPTRLLAHLCYACGLRIGEATAIRIKDMDLESCKLTIVGGKGKKDRFINLPPSLVPRLKLQLAAAEAAHKKARAMGVPAKLPHKLSGKYPAAPFQRRWFWLFPMHEPCDDPRGGGRVWWHCLSGPVQSAMRAACRATGVEGLTPHHLRHRWAVDAREMGSRVEDIQEVMGHKDIRTTLRYIHPEPERVPSPFDNLGIAV